MFSHEISGDKCSQVSFRSYMHGLVEQKLVPGSQTDQCGVTHCDLSLQKQRWLVQEGQPQV